VGPKPPNVHPASTRGSAKPTSWQARATQSIPPTSAQHQALGPRLCPRFHQSWANYLLSAAGNSGIPREGWRTQLYWPDPSPRLGLVQRKILKKSIVQFSTLLTVRDQFKNHSQFKFIAILVWNGFHNWAQLFHNVLVLAVSYSYPFKDKAQTALFKDPVRTAM
jgi:hypothetical protein